MPAYAAKHPAPFRNFASKISRNDESIGSVHEPYLFGQLTGKRNTTLIQPADPRQARSSSARPQTSSMPSTTRRNIRQAFFNQDELSKHVEHMYTNDYNSHTKDKCRYCSKPAGVSHQRDYHSKPKLVRKIPKQALVRLYGHKSNLITDPPVSSSLPRKANHANIKSVSSMPSEPVDE